MSFIKTIQNGETKCFAVDDKFYIGSKVEDRLDDGFHFFWNKTVNPNLKNSVDLRDVFNFYRVSEINELASVFSSQNITKYCDLKKRIHSILYSYGNVGVDIKDYPFYDLVPTRILKDLCLNECKILKDGFNFLEKKSWFKDVLDFFVRFESINALRDMDYQIRTEEGWQKVRLMWQANFRFKSLPGYLNLFNMRKKDRNKVLPHSDDHIIYYADFRQFEVRTFIMLHPHLEFDFENRELYKDLAARLNLDLSTAKQQIIAYGYGQENEALDKVLDRNALLKNVRDDFYSWNGYPVVFRPKETDKIKIHTLVQTVAQYIYIKKLYKILNLIAETNSKFIYPLHDSVIISLHKDELELIPKICDILEDDVYKVEQCLGPNLGELEVI